MTLPPEPPTQISLADEPQIDVRTSGAATPDATAHQSTSSQEGACVVQLSSAASQPMPAWTASTMASSEASLRRVEVGDDSGTALSVSAQLITTAPSSPSDAKGSPRAASDEA